MVPAEAVRLTELPAARKKLAADVMVMTIFPMVHTGKFVKPGDTFRIHGPAARAGRLRRARRVCAEAGFAPEEGDHKRRLALSKWFELAGNPLAARVIVNRIWHYPFGTGLINTPSDFDLNGGRASHSGLIDWLADELVASVQLIQSHGLPALCRALFNANEFLTVS